MTSKNTPILKTTCTFKLFLKLGGFRITRSTGIEQKKETKGKEKKQHIKNKAENKNAIESRKREKEKLCVV